MKTVKSLLWVAIAGLVIGLSACSSPSSDQSSDSTEKEPQVSEEAKSEVDKFANKGVGPITSVTLDEELNIDMAVEGKQIFEDMCTACHRADRKFIGPAPVGILDRRSPEWIMNMILDPEKMVAEDEDAKQLLIEYNGSPMANQNLTEEQARAVLEYFRTL